MNGGKAREVVAVTGAAGSLGQALIRLLVDHGLSVRAMVRRAQQANKLKELGAEAIIGDVLEPARVGELVAGVSCVYHLAAWMGAPGSAETAERVNMEGTASVVREAARAGVRRVVLASSIAVYGPVREGVIDETTPYWSVGDMYSDSKIGAEKRARQEAEASGIELVILRPTMIYGPASPSWTVTPFQMIAKGLPVIIGDGEDLLDAVYVDDVARAFAAAGQVRQAAGEVFNVAGESATWNAFLGYYASMARVKLRRLPAGLVWRGARFAEAVTRAATGSRKVIPEMIGVMNSRARFSGDKAARVLGYRPQIGLDQGMKDTERWLRREGLLRLPKVALVTGAGSGLGRATVRNLMAKGLIVYASDVDTDSLLELEQAGARSLTMDVTSDESVREACATVARDGEVVDVLINAAGINLPGALETQAMADVRRQLEVNALGPLRVARTVSPEMRERGWGRIINVSSTNGFIVAPFVGAYSASKFALEALSDAMRLELAPFGVEVAVIEPGSMRTPFADRAKDALKREIESGDQAWADLMNRVLTGDLWGESTATEPDDVARVIAAAALSRRVPARRFGTWDAIPARVMAMMPAVVKDTFFMRAAGLAKGHGRASE